MDGINAMDFIQLVKSGHSWLKQHVEAVNSLNVFPVPDGDTGTNMELSLASGIRAWQGSGDWTLHAAVQSLNQGLLMGARGNSGVILSQLFRGFLRLDPSLDTLRPYDFALAMHEGVQIAYKAVSKPVEGTILTVARETAAVALKESRTATDFGSWLTAVVAAARASLAKTPSLLPVLREANVVDSGGQGLLFIYEGFLRCVTGHGTTDGSSEPPVVVPAIVAPSAPSFGQMHQAGSNEFGYCTEFLVRIHEPHAKAWEQELRSKLSSYGDSMLVVQVDDLLKVHVHTLHPGRVLEDALEVGPLLQVKIENMTEQNAALRHEDNGDSAPRKTSAPSIAVVAVASGEGIRSVFESLGATIVIDGGPTMNPCTEDIASAIQSTGANTVIVLPNHKNVRLSAEQASAVVGADVHVVPTENIPQGIAALVAFHVGRSASENVEGMMEAANGAICGQVVRAARETVYQNWEIRPGQYIGMRGSDVVFVGHSRDEAMMEAARDLIPADAELLTLFYGEAVDVQEAKTMAERLEEQFHIDVECQHGGQPVYDYIFSVE